jgi:glycerol-3-phosphate dehydrogenase
VAPTVFGNVIVGPTAVDTDSRDDTSSTADGVARLRDVGERIVPALLKHETTAVYVGLRAATEHDDYQVFVDAERGYACAGGIRSTGLTSSMAIAERLREGLADGGLELHERAGGLPAVRMPNIGEASPRPYCLPDRIAEDPEYGRIVCFCERVTRGEVRDAAASAIPPHDLDGLRRRTRALMGRCQGFFCGAEIPPLLAHHTGQDVDELREQPR